MSWLRFINCLSYKGCTDQAAPSSVPAPRVGSMAIYILIFDHNNLHWALAIRVHDNDEQQEQLARLVRLTYVNSLLWAGGAPGGVAMVVGLKKFLVIVKLSLFIGCAALARAQHNEDHEQENKFMFIMN